MCLLASWEHLGKFLIKINFIFGTTTFLYNWRSFWKHLRDKIFTNTKYNLSIDYRMKIDSNLLTWDYHFILQMQVFGSWVCIKWQANWEIWCFLVWRYAVGTDNWKASCGSLRRHGGQLSRLGLNTPLNRKAFSYFSIVCFYNKWC